MTQEQEKAKEKRVCNLKRDYEYCQIWIDKNFGCATCKHYQLPKAKQVLTELEKL